MQDLTASHPTNGMLSCLRRDRRLFAWGALAGFVFRIFFLLRFRLLTNDTFVYGAIAKNWIETGVFGFAGTPSPIPTWIRMPGYPAFLAAIWAIFGKEHYTAVLATQIFCDVGTCFVIADLTRRVVSERAAKTAFILAVSCPFFANYAAVALTETLAIFFAALALDLAVWALDADRLTPWAACGVAVACGILLRPDGGIVLICIGLYLVIRLAGARDKRLRLHFLSSGAVLASVALTPLIPWTLRNWRDFHRFQPLTTVYASAADEFVPYGFYKWVRTWIVDYSSVEDIWFKVPSEEIQIRDLPPRAIDNSEQRRQTEGLFARYNDLFDVSPEMDAQFNQLANTRIRASYLRYYVWLPLLRATALWLRPRTEMLPLDRHWWRWRDDPHDSAWAIFLGLMNLFYVLSALIGLRHWKAIRYGWLLISFVLIRTVFLAWMPNPEPRYVLECYPVVLVFSAATFAAWKRRPAAEAA
ncbi:MAG TPA: glycosyltransferase family 39 protein [Terriglobales bacterium]|nr:glycosyltransferase family 39 protein [Terriglobales bacterium]